MRNKKEKGRYGYRNYRKKIECGKVVFGCAMILIQLGVRELTGVQVVRNALTLMAVLSVLPTANAAAPLIASWRFHSPSSDFHSRMSALEPGRLILYDLLLTSKEQIFPADAAAVHPSGISIFCPSQKADLKKAKELIGGRLKDQGLSSVEIWITTDENAFFHRVSSMKPTAGIDSDPAPSACRDAVARLLMSLSM